MKCYEGFEINKNCGSAHHGTTYNDHETLLIVNFTNLYGIEILVGEESQTGVLLEFLNEKHCDLNTIEFRGNDVEIVDYDIGCLDHVVPSFLCSSSICVYRN